LERNTKEKNIFEYSNTAVLKYSKIPKKYNCKKI
jgi:hypothetical protein